MNLELWKQQKKALNMTFEELAKKSNIAKGSLQNIFAGYVPNPRIDTVEAIEEALGLKDRYEWTDEEKALGVGRRATYLSEDEWEWLELRSLIIENQGEHYLKTLQAILKALPKVTPKS